MNQLISIPTLTINHDGKGIKTYGSQNNSVIALSRFIKSINNFPVTQINSNPWNKSEPSEDIKPRHEYLVKVLTQKKINAYLQEALEELQDVDEEAREEGFDLCSTEAKESAERILYDIYEKYPQRYTVYPTPDREIAISISGNLGHGVLILCGPEKEAACFVTRASQNKRARYDSVDELPDSFVLQALSELNSNL